MPEPDIRLFASTDWDALTPSAARQEIDEAVFAGPELTAGEREAVYVGVMESVENRRLRVGVWLIALWGVERGAWVWLLGQ